MNDQGQQVFACTAGSTGCTNGETIAPTGDDEMIIGNANPKFTLGLRSNGGWGHFDASWLWRGEFGKDVFNNTALVYSTKGNAKSSRNFLAAALDDPTGINEPAIYSSRWIENGRFIRLQNATVGYTFALPGLGGGRTTRVYLSGDNLLLFTPYTRLRPRSVHRRQHQRRGDARHRLPDVSASPHVHGWRTRRLLSVHRSHRSFAYNHELRGI